MRIIECEQGTDAWKAARCAKVTASNISDVLSRDRSGKAEGTTRRNYKARLVCETLTGISQEGSFSNKAMADGIENEPFGRSAYEVAHEVMVDRVGFIVHPLIDRFGASPDGLVDPARRGVLEVKCPIPATHIAWLLAGVAPTEHQPQMIAEMACTELPWVDFVSYCPALPPNLQLFTVRFPRDEARIKAMEAEVRVFLTEVDDLVAKLRERAQ